MITVTVGALDAETARLAEVSTAVSDRLAREIDRLGAVVRERVERKLSGEVLQRRSGRLAASIVLYSERSGPVATATIGSDAPYAAIHEYGGILPARTILPRRARALAFPWRGRQRFFQRVALPAVTMPERSFLRSALAETEPEIRAALAAAMREVLQ